MRQPLKRSYHKDLEKCPVVNSLPKSGVPCRSENRALQDRQYSKRTVLVFPIAHADGQVVSTALAMVTAVLIVTAKPCEIVHRFPSTCTAWLGHRLLSVAKICQ